MQTQSPSANTVTAEIDGKTYTGSFVVEGHAVTVTYGIRTLTTRTAGARSVESTARMLLRELVPGGTGMD